MVVVFAPAAFLAIELITVLNRRHRFRGFVYHSARFSSDHESIEIAVRPREGSSAVCSRSHRPAPGYDQLGERRFEFIPFEGVLVFLLCSMRRVKPRRCSAVVVEEAPWGDGKRQLTKAQMPFLALWARRLSWIETVEAFRTSWDKVFDAVEHVVTWGPEHRTLGQIDAIGVDEIQYAKRHKDLTLVLSDRTRHHPSALGGQRENHRVLSRILYHHRRTGGLPDPLRLLGPVGAYLKVIRENCSEALHILDRFHIVAKMNKALDEVRAEESRRIKSEGREPVLRKSRWLLLKRPAKLANEQRFRRRDLLRYT